MAATLSAKPPPSVPASNYPRTEREIIHTLRLRHAGAVSVPAKLGTLSIPAAAPRGEGQAFWVCAWIWV